MTDKDFAIDERELAIFIRYNNVYEKYIAKIRTDDVKFVSEENKDALIKDYIEKISKEKEEIIRNNADIRKISYLNFWVLNRNYEEIISGLIKEEDIAFIEILKR